MNTKKKKDLLVNTLVSERFVAVEIVEVLQKEAMERGLHVLDLLLEKGVVTRTEIGIAKANQHDVRFVRLEKVQISNDVCRAVLPPQAHNFRIIPIEDNGEGLVLATDDFLVSNEFEELTNVLGRSYELQICASDAMDEALERYYFSGKDEGRRLREERLLTQVD